MTESDVVYHFNGVLQKLVHLVDRFVLKKKVYAKQILNLKSNPFEKKCLKQWQQRKLKLCTYVTCICHNLSSLPDPAKHTIKHIETIKYDFIWDFKPTQIKVDILTMDNENVVKN